MAYGILKCDQITFTNGGSDQTISVSGIVQSISGNITATGTIQGATIIGTSTVSGATVTGDAGVFTTVTGGSAGFTTVTGTTVTGTTANFNVGTFTSQVSGATVTGNLAQFTSVTGGTAGFTTVTGTTVTGTTANFVTVSGTTVTGNAGQFTTITGTSAGFTTITGATVTGSVGNFGSGSAAAPSVSVGTTDNGIYSPGAYQVAISTNGTGRLFIAADGDIGINTSAPRSAGSNFKNFEIVGDSADRGGAIFLSSSDDSRRAIQFLTDTYVISTATNHPIAFETNSSERLRITSDGKVGLGTSSPQQLLDCSSSATGGPIIRLSNSSTSIAQDTEYGRLEWYSADTSTGGTGVSNYIGAYAINAGVRSALTFGVRHDSGVFEAMRLDNLGRLGVGTTSPAGTLHVNGGSATIIADSGVYSTYENYISGVRKAFYQWDNSANLINIVALPASSQIVFKTADTERGRWDGFGRLLVGTSSAYSFTNANGTTDTPRLEVTGVYGGFQEFNASMGLYYFSGAVGGSRASALGLARSRGSNAGDQGLVDPNDRLGEVSFHGSDGTAFRPAARIEALVDGTPGANDMPGRLVFSTTADGASSPTEQLRITSDRYVRLASGSGGIQFNGDTAAANALDDYEEGTWTPVVNTSNADATVTWTTGPNARYTKIGRQVHLVLYGGISVSAAGTGYPQITGVPIAATTAFFAGSLSYASAFNSSGIAPKLYNTTVDILNTNSVSAGPSLQTGFIAMFISYTV